MSDNIKLLKQVAKKIKQNNMMAYVVNNSKEATDLVKKLIKKGDVITNGGSQSIKECGVIDLVTNGDYNYIDRTKMDPREAYIKSFSADVYFCSSNAVTEDGYLYNVDGNSNRVAAIAYGPLSVIMIVGINKIVKNLEAAEKRVKTIAAPLNCERLEINSFCKKTGKCISLENNEHEICDGCDSNGRICCNFLISGKQRHKDRIKVILVNENLGY